MSSLQKTSVYAFKCLLITYNVCRNMYVSRVYQHVTEKSPWLKKSRGFSFDRLFGKIDIRYFLRDAIHHGVRHDEPYVIAERKKCLYFPFQKNSGNTRCSIEKFDLPHICEMDHRLNTNTGAKVHLLVLAYLDFV